MLFAPLLNFPLLLFAAVLPFTLLGALLIRRTRPGSDAAVRALGTLAMLQIFLLVAGLLVYAIRYMGSPTFTDHIEPTTAAVAWLYGQGEQIYHAVDAPERYAFLYGPVSYIATSWSYSLLGPGVLAAKFAGFICLLVSFAFLSLSVRKRYPGQIRLIFVALGYFSIVALFFKNHSFWSKPDSFMIAASAIGLYACLLRPGRVAWVVCGLALGVAANAKITGAVYFLPYIAWFWERDGYRGPFITLLAAAVVGLMPFWATDQVSLVNYLSWLRSAGDHGLGNVLLLQNAVFLLFLLGPVLLFLAWQGGSVGIRSWTVNRRLMVGTSAIAGLLILIAASKVGSGPHHFLPFLPPLAFLAAHAVANVKAYKPTTDWSVYGFWAPLAALLIAAGLKASIALYYGLSIVMSQANATALVDELRTIMVDYPGWNIQMGYGDGSHYVRTLIRPELVYQGQPYLLDAAAMMDFQFSGHAIPQATIDKLLQDEAIWLIPKGEEPFTLVNWYYRYEGGLLFDENFRSAFSSGFTKLETKNFFDLYAPVGDTKRSK